jgi:uncharacterized protein YciI
MKQAFAAVAFFVLTSQFIQAQNESSSNGPQPQIRQYWFVLLTKGPHRDQDSATAAKLQRGHLENIGRLYNEGKIKVAGPFGEEGDWQGIFIFDCATREEVEKLLQTDPSIAAGRMVYQVKSWYTAPMGSFVPGKPAKPLF